MSVVRCEKCSSQIDTDYDVESFETGVHLCMNHRPEPKPRTMGEWLFEQICNTKRKPT